MNNLKLIPLLILTLGLVSCDTKYQFANTWACPKGATYKTWKDGYPGEDKKYLAIGCRDSNGDRVGFHIAWKDYGIKEHQGWFKNDKPDGEWSYFHPNGSMSSRGFYDEGVRVGVWAYWDDDGKFTHERNYDDV